MKHRKPSSLPPPATVAMPELEDFQLVLLICSRIKCPPGEFGNRLRELALTKGVSAGVLATSWRVSTSWIQRLYRWYGQVPPSVELDITYRVISTPTIFEPHRTEVSDAGFQLLPPVPPLPNESHAGVPPAPIKTTVDYGAIRYRQDSAFGKLVAKCNGDVKSAVLVLENAMTKSGNSPGLASAQLLRDYPGVFPVNFEATHLNWMLKQNRKSLGTATAPTTSLEKPADSKPGLGDLKLRRGSVIYLLVEQAGGVEALQVQLRRILDEKQGNLPSTLKALKAASPDIFTDTYTISQLSSLLDRLQIRMKRGRSSAAVVTVSPERAGRRVGRRMPGVGDDRDGETDTEHDESDDSSSSPVPPAEHSADTLLTPHLRPEGLTNFGNETEEALKAACLREELPEPQLILRLCKNADAEKLVDVAGVLKMGVGILQALRMHYQSRLPAGT